MKLLTVSADDGSDGYEILTGNEAEVEDEESGGDHPVHIAGIEELPAAGDSSPALYSAESCHALSPVITSYGK